MSAGFLVKTIFIVEKPYKELKTPEFNEKYGTLLEELEIEKDTILARYYYPIFMIRRALYAAILILFSDSPTLQVGLIELIVHLPVWFIFLQKMIVFDIIDFYEAF